MVRNTLLVAAVMLAATLIPARAQEAGPTGALGGTIFDGETRQPVPMTNIVLSGTRLGASSDLEGRYKVSSVPVGTYTIMVSALGYERQTRTDIVVSSDRTTILEVYMRPILIEMEGAVVTDGYFSHLDVQPVSVASFSSEEIRRQAGSAGDISRVIISLPSLARVNDAMNSLIVRGGSPVENGFYIDNIEVPNINHFPVQGSSDGPIGLLNVEFVRDVQFSSGAFSSLYGDRLSSIMDLKLREGSREGIQTQLDLSMQGLGGVVEGPLADKRGSWFVSARRSYLDLIFKSIEPNAAIPTYSDIQGKAVYDISDKHKVSMVSLMALDNVSQTRDGAREAENNMYADFRLLNSTVGLNWQYLWSLTGYSEVSLAHTIMRSNGDLYETLTGGRLLDNRSSEQELKFRNKNHIRFTPFHATDIGLDMKMLLTSYDYAFSEYTDRLGNTTPPMRVNTDIRSLKAGFSLHHVWKVTNDLTFSPGARVDYFEFSGNAHVSPRFSATVELTTATSLTAAAGVFYQNLPMLLLAQDPSFRDLRDPRADHYVLGLTHLLSENTQLTVEVYNKEYRDCPMDPSQSGLFVLDEAVDAGGIMNHTELRSEGRANTRGVEVMIQKKLATDLYGVVAGSYFRSRYRDLEGTWRDRLYDNKFTLTAEGGYKLNERWEFSARWLYAGGAPYTPFDEPASAELRRGVYDGSQINAQRLPDYHSLNVRVDRRFHYQSSTFIAYVSLWNVYGRENISRYEWNGFDNERRPVPMWGTFPVVGLEYEF